LKRRHQHGLVVAPHPYYPSSTCLLGYLDRYPKLFDAVEYNAMFTSSLNFFNKRAERWAEHHDKPMVGNCDVHQLQQLGTTYSLVDAEPHPDAICKAIAAGRVRVEAQPLSWSNAASIMTAMVMASIGGARHRHPPASGAWLATSQLNRMRDRSPH